MSDTRIHLGHAAIVTPDLDRLRQFYEHALGLRVVAEDVPPVEGLTRLAALSDGRSVALLAFERPDAEPAPKIRPGSPIHHLTFMAGDVDDFESAIARLVETGSSDGAINAIGPMLAVSFTDPDGRAMSLQRLNPDWDPASIGADPAILTLLGGGDCS